MVHSSFEPFFSEVGREASAVPGFSMGRGEEGTATTLCPLRDFPCRENIPLPGRLTNFLILLPKLEGQLDVPKYCHSLGLAHSSCTGCREPLLWWSKRSASQQQKASIFSPFPVDFTLT